MGPVLAVPVIAIGGAILHDITKDDDHTIVSTSNSLKNFKLTTLAPVRGTLTVVANEDKIYAELCKLSKGKPEGVDLRHIAATIAGCKRGSSNQWYRFVATSSEAQLTCVVLGARRDDSGKNVILSYVMIAAAATYHALLEVEWQYSNGSLITGSHTRRYTTERDRDLTSAEVAVLRSKLQSLIGTITV